MVERLLINISIVLSLFIMVSVPQVAAFTQNDFNCTNNSDCFYEASTCSTDGSAATGTTAPGTIVPDDQLPGNKPEEKVWNYLISLNFTPVQAAGIWGNIANEGGFNPTQIQIPPGGNTKDPSNLTTLEQGWGMFGFTPGNSIFGAPWNSSGVKVTKDNVYYMSTQMSVVYGYMKNNTDIASGKNMLKAYEDQATSPGAAALAFMNIVENPDTTVSHDDKRQASAEQAMHDYGGQAAATVTASASGGGANCCPSGAATADFAAGTLPSTVPEPYNKIFTAAANKFGIAPALLAGIFYGGEHGNSWPDPPPPYGHGSPWASSSVGASGPFQFIPSTWDAYGVDGNGDGKKDIQDLTDGAFGAAKYLSASGAKGSDESTFHDAIFAYNHAEWYVTNVLNAYHKFGGAASGNGNGASTPTGTSGGCSSGGALTGYQNPLRDIKSLGKLRIDQGVDYSGHGPVYAIGPGKVAEAYHYGEGSGWPGPGGQSGGWISYTLTDGPAKGKTVYFAESCQPKVRPGDKVDANTVICDMEGDNYPWTETGWAASASPGDTQPLAQLYEGNGCCSTTVGVNFSDLLKSLGAPPGVLTNNPPIGKQLPGDFPTWK
jgi:hypothetical protein